MDLTVREHGFCGSFYEGKKHPDKVIIYVGSCNMWQEDIIAGGTFLLGAGYTVLFLDTGNCVPIPVDYVESAVKWLKDYFGHRNVKIGMAGWGMGATYALLCASHIPKITGVAACSPYDYIMEASDSKFHHFRKALFQYHGSSFVYSPWFILEEGMPRLLLKSLKDSRYGIGRFSRYIYDRNVTAPGSRILVENMHADVLFLASDNDDILPAETAAERMEKVLKEKNYRYRVQTKIYENGSHILGCGLDFDSKWGRKMKKTIPAMRKNPKEAKKAAADSMAQIIRFFNIW